MARTTSKRLIRLLVAALTGAVLFWGSVWAQGGPSVTEALALAHEAGLPDPFITQVVALTYDAGFDRSAAARTIIVLAEAHRAAFDMQAFMNRLEEGISKRIHGTRIAQVLEERLARLMLVSERLQLGRETDDSAYQAAVAALADGLEMGLTSQDLDTLVERAGDAPVAMTAVAAEMWALLKQLEVAPNLTDQILSEGLAQRALNPAWRHFPQIVAIARQKGVPDEATFAEALKGLQAGGVPADLLIRLGFTGRNLQDGPMGSN